MDLLLIKVDEIPEGGMSVDIPGQRREGDRGDDANEGLEWSKDLVPLDVHTVIDGRSWQDQLLGILNDPYLKFSNGFYCWINLFRSGRSVIVKGQIVTTAELTCSRCAEPFDYEFNIVFRSVLTRDDAKDRDKEKELTQKELEYSFFSGERIDLGLTITEQIAIHIPVKPLCRKECQGLCGVCGKNLNIERCDCKDKEVDIRFAKLKNLIIE
ncbi:MAG: DUF177 domain-containing protein [Deltaproteobacteria bacterium]|uniref:DUF177 domain-containing protein n=1 Tax=Candidatus Zymogenus saltonus TaxID=2844893 RepID=A0A9D8KFT3_9DELT|nr:DUF177 domain-containing protein [Candidatus Zymogenus saltonus]